ncbi:MAG: aconitate hydratase [Alphaproteobacteria bacterium]|nr:aconitate hydratase [Alphaproteobacteria bacterium]
MSIIETSPELIARLYALMRQNLDVVRGRLQRPLTLAEKLLFGHLDAPEVQAFEPGESYLSLRPDRVAFQDVLGQTGLLQFMQTGLDRVAVPTSIHCDHLIQARVDADRDLSESLVENSEVYDFLQSAAARYGAGFWKPGAGIIHQVILENYAFPGALIIGTDSHTPNAGGLGACAIGVGGADAVEVISGLPWELLYPRRIGIVLTGQLNGWSAPKDIILYIAGRLGVAGGTNAILEYVGPGVATISATGKATIANMGAELGATSSVFPYDDKMAAYLRATGRGALTSIVDDFRDLFAPDAEVLAEPAAHYDEIVELDLSTLEPHVVGPHSPDRARPISDLAAEVRDGQSGFVAKISAALIGSCTNSSYEDMSRAADVAQQAAAQGLAAVTPFFVTPGSEQVRATIDRDGQMAALQAVDGSVLANACGPCIGQWRRNFGKAGEPNTIVTSFNRNFPGRNDGSPETLNFIASPEIVTALAIAGDLTFNPLTDSLTGANGEPFKFAPPKPAPEVPELGFDPGKPAYIAPPEDGRSVVVNIDPESERLERMVPWAPWDGEDFMNMPVLAKVSGKTTTDQISPAGPWLKLRGHLSRFSDNMLMGGVNAYTGERGVGLNVLSGKTGDSFANIARDYQAQSVKWAIIGDWNYGEGSSREHAALSPRLLGGVVVIARSFARIHETNLKKQGLLALTFSDPADYERLKEDDRLDLAGLSALEAGKPVDCDIRRADGDVETITLKHSYTSDQLQWFRAGSALNVLRQKTG